MKTRRLWKSIALASLVLCSAPQAFADINLGVIAPRGDLAAKKRWSAFADYLGQKTGETVNLIPLAPAKVMPAAKDKKVDLVLGNPVHSLKLEETQKATLLATLNTKSGPNFAGVIVAKKGSGISKAADLKGKKVMSLKFRSAAGAYVFQTYYLHQQGIDPHKDFSAMTEGKKQDDLVMAVSNGTIDAAFVRSGILEAMDREGKINKDDFVVVDQRDNDGLGLAHTTELYPEWYLSALPHVNAAMAEKVKKAALALAATDAVAKLAKIKGFVEPLPLDGMKTAFKALKIAPYGG